jgi:hypothetical protein
MGEAFYIQLNFTPTARWGMVQGFDFQSFDFGVGAGTQRLSGTAKDTQGGIHFEHLLGK